VLRCYRVLAYAAFVATSLWGVLFLADLGALPTVDSHPGPWAVDLGLWLLFGLQHSGLARARRVDRSTYVLSTALVLALLFWQWRALPGPVWRVGTPLPWVPYAAGWALAVASTFMIDHADFTGLRRRPAEGLSRRWAYGVVRHPMMLGLLVAFWATPVMTAGHLLFAAAGSIYVGIGLRFEERGLRRSLGPAYAEYAREVPLLLPRLRRGELPRRRRLEARVVAGVGRLQQPGTGAGPGHDGARRADLVPAAAAQDEVDGLLAAGVHEVERGAAGRLVEVPVAPAHQCDEHRVEVEPGVGQPVFEPGPAARLPVGVAPQDAGVDERREPGGEDLPGRADPAVQVVEAPHAGEDLAQDEQRPLLPDQLEAPGDRARVGVVPQRLRDHDPTLSSLDRPSNRPQGWIRSSDPGGRP
jgi:methanethiol S-methyltransferase